MREHDGRTPSAVKRFGDRDEKGELFFIECSNDLDLQQRGAILPSVEKETVIAAAQTDEPRGEPVSEISAGGIVLSEESTCNSLRAACRTYGLGMSGGKQKLFQRLVQHQQTQKLLDQRKLVLEKKEIEERTPKQVTTVPKPSPKAQRLHNLTHIPYQPWCEHCLKHRARDD